MELRNRLDARRVARIKELLPHGRQLQDDLHRGTAGAVREKIDGMESLHGSTARVVCPIPYGDSGRRNDGPQPRTGTRRRSAIVAKVLGSKAASYTPVPHSAQNRRSYVEVSDSRHDIDLGWCMVASTHL